MMNNMDILVLNNMMSLLHTLVRYATCAYFVDGSLPLGIGLFFLGRVWFIILIHPCRLSGESPSM